MSSALHAEIVRSRQQDAAILAVHARHASEVHQPSAGRRVIRRCVAGVLAAVGTTRVSTAVAAITPASASPGQEASTN